MKKKVQKNNTLFHTVYTLHYVPDDDGSRYLYYIINNITRYYVYKYTNTHTHIGGFDGRSNTRAE